MAYNFDPPIQSKWSYKVEINNKTSAMLTNINFNVKRDVLPKPNGLSQHVGELTTGAWVLFLSACLCWPTWYLCELVYNLFVQHPLTALEVDASFADQISLYSFLISLLEKCLMKSIGVCTNPGSASWYLCHVWQVTYFLWPLSFSSVKWR